MENGTRALVSLAALAVLVILAPPAHGAQILQGIVIRVVEGDDVEVMDASGGLIRVRLVGIDAPERPQPWGDEARRALTERVLGQTVRVEVRGKDRQRRTLGVVSLGTVNINLWLVQKGHAWYSRGGRNRAPAALKRELQAAEQEARELRRGLWLAPNPEPPWLFRQRRRPGR